MFASLLIQSRLLSVNHSKLLNILIFAGTCATLVAGCIGQDRRGGIGEEGNESPITGGQLTTSGPDGESGVVAPDSSETSGTKDGTVSVGDSAPATIGQVVVSGDDALPPHSGVAGIGGFVPRPEFDPRAFVREYEKTSIAPWVTMIGFPDSMLSIATTPKGETTIDVNRQPVDVFEAFIDHLIDPDEFEEGEGRLHGTAVLLRDDIILLPPDVLLHESVELAKMSSRRLEVALHAIAADAEEGIDPDIQREKREELGIDDIDAALFEMLSSAILWQFYFQGLEQNTLDKSYDVHVVDIPYAGIKPIKYLQSRSGLSEYDFAMGTTDLSEEFFPYSLASEALNQGKFYIENTGGGIVIELPCRIPPEVALPVTLDTDDNTVSAAPDSLPLSLVGYGRHSCTSEDPTGIWFRKSSDGPDADPIHNLDYLKRSRAIERDGSTLKDQVFSLYCEHDDGAAIMRGTKFYGYLAYFNSIDHASYDSPGSIQKRMTDRFDAAQIVRVNNQGLDIETVLKTPNDPNKQYCKHNTRAQQSTFDQQKYDVAKADLEAFLAEQAGQ